MTLSIIANPTKYQVKEHFIAALEWARKAGVRVYVKDHLCRELDVETGTSVSRVESDEEAIRSGDYTLVLGGDGTILHVAALAMHHKKPILGVNSGRLGFMANTQKENLDYALNCLKDENFSLDSRHFLQAEAQDGNIYHALNEFLFTRRDSTSMISVEAGTNGDKINTYWADGLIVSSPTGSTAYNLSAGGPIVMPGTEVLVLTPINPHTLTTRPLVLPSDKKLTIHIPPQRSETLFSYDGNVVEIHDLPFSIHIERSEYTVDLVQLPEQNYFETLRNKLLWGSNSRRHSDL